MLCVAYDIGLDDIKQILSSSDSAVIVLNVENTIILTIASYVIGHIVAYLSSITVEKLTIWSYGYPSQFLLGNQHPGFYRKDPTKKLSKNLAKESTNDTTKDAKGSKGDPIGWSQSVVRTLIGFCLLPISLPAVFIHWCNLDNFIIKKLDDVLVATIRSNQEYLLTFLKITPSDPNADLHRIVYHYVYEHQNHHAVKLDNYVAIYGFLRALTLIVNCTCMLVIIKGCHTIDFSNDVDWHYITTILVLAFLTNVFYMGFIKFYRRFTLESYMSLVTDITFKHAEPINISYSYSNAGSNEKKYSVFMKSNELASNESKTENQ